MTTLVSACLLGFPCRPDCKDKRDERVLAALAGDEAVPGEDRLEELREVGR